MTTREELLAEIHGAAMRIDAGKADERDRKLLFARTYVFHNGLVEVDVDMDKARELGLLDGEDS